MASQGNANVSRLANSPASAACLLSVIVGASCALMGYSRYPFVLVSFLSLVLVRDLKTRGFFFYALALPSMLFMIQSAPFSRDFTGFAENVGTGTDFSFYLSAHEYFSYIYFTALSYVGSGQFASTLMSFTTSSLIALSMLLAFRNIGLKSLAIVAAMSAIDYPLVIHLQRQSIGLSLLFLALSIVVGNWQYNSGRPALDLFIDSYRHLGARQKTSVTILFVAGAFTHQVCTLFILTIALSFLVPGVLAWLSAASIYTMYNLNSLPSSSYFDTIIRELYARDVGKLDVFFMYNIESYATLQPFAQVSYFSAIVIPICMAFIKTPSDSARSFFLNNLFLLSIAVTLPLSSITVIGPRFGLVSTSLITGVPLVIICLLLRRTILESRKTGYQYSLPALFE
jgi:hypothetical protein